MSAYKFFIPIKVRYGDLDAQWHVNHTRFLTFIEQARLEYLLHLGLFDGKSFLDLRVIIADVHISYIAPITLGQKVRVGTCTTKIGNKSISFEYILEDADNGKILAKSEVVCVAYDFRNKKTVRVPLEWRNKIAEFEGRSYD
ncbi:MAG: acyl-CoA thioesterase [Anaerolineaceae bacterium]|nr:acyl-CoA thioesterase [Anaerolineaceae bacterium]